MNNAIDFTYEAGAGTSPAIGLSNVHIPTALSTGVGNVIKGAYGSTDGYMPWSGPPSESSTPLGPVVLSGVPDKWVSVRRWADGISVGSGMFAGAGGARRGVVQELSRWSGTRMLRFLREADAQYRYMGTLTLPGEYGSAAAFRMAVDRWLTSALRKMQRASIRAGGSQGEAGIFWFVEFQERGAPHLHCFYTHAIPWQELSSLWASSVRDAGAGNADDWAQFARTSTRFEQLRGGFRGMMGYARKYATKTEQKTPPKDYWRGRFWGVRGNRALGSCRAVGLKGRPEGKKVAGLRAYLDGLAAAGLLRRFAWSHGDGAVYVVRGGGRWTEMGEVGVKIERMLRDIVLECAISAKAKTSA